jgi:acetyl esterase/lipase
MLRFPPSKTAGSSLIGTGLMASALIAAPILAQQGDQGDDRLSRVCIREIVKLCGPDRAQMRNCIQSRGDQLSGKCQAELRERMGQRRDNPEARQAAAAQRTARPTRTVFYGSDPRQQIDVYEPAGAVEELPLVLFIHGGGWRIGNHKLIDAKPAHFGAQEIYFASAGYRLLPDAPVEEQARDVGAAVQALVGQAGALGFDAERIVLMGHSAGAHLAALVASDPRYAGEAFGAIRGVVLLDGAAYDVAAQMTADGPVQQRIYRDAFGADPARQAALSPITHVGAPDAPHWLALYVNDRPDARAQSEALVGALAREGADARAIAIAGTDHGAMNRDLGQGEDAGQTAAVDAFLAEVFD